MTTKNPNANVNSRNNEIKKQIISQIILFVIVNSQA